MASRLPAFPRVVFTIFEPLSLISGSLPAILAPDWFIQEQIAGTSGTVASDRSRLVAQQLGNTYGLLFLLGVAVLYTSTELRVVRNYLVALLIADASHVGFTIWGLGLARFIAVDEWNAMTWGNIGVTTLLALTRVAYLLGLFGPDKPGTGAISKKAD
ncbi:hypothetical protein CMQ_5774 [Grosmannia clavigera kw1407]|uniref:DUF7704 domain-containing protein n=1 Tax=Grosmannia clavigera (strain kw1407 / UAMH 11150) TaxID=655863 RepID=F0XT87_GROCL|nr:uncharacterized protein CMQ_5774 [Grosmannia clavigera kw1407]EFW99353.1 hypothetical protein CMQ_5774 [Grosmannia clavigera kw1407]